MFWVIKVYAYVEFIQPFAESTALQNYHSHVFGGADQSVDKDLFRTASYKGALRFWWRALQWGKYMEDAKGDTAQALMDLHKKEGELFGQASDGKDSRQSRVRIQAMLENSKVVTAGGTELKSLSYLLGQGLYHFSNGASRDYLAGGDVRATLSFDPGTGAEDIRSVERAAIALGLFGALGSRARKGLGSLSLQEIQHARGGEKSALTQLSSIQSFVKTLDFRASKEPPFSALCKGSRFVVTGWDGNAIKALAKVGEELQLYRGYGRHNPRTGEHEVNGKTARQKFKADHDNVLRAAQAAVAPAQLPDRAVFGLPHNYFFSSSGAKMDIAPEGGGRRASPLFIHIHALDDGQFIAIQTLLSAMFLHRDIAVEAKPSKGRPQAIARTHVDYSVIHRYLDDFKNKPGYKELYPHA